MVIFQGIGWCKPGKAGEVAREGWHLHHPERQECREAGDCQEAAVAGGSKSR